MHKIYTFTPKCNPRSVYQPRTVFWGQNAHIHFENLVLIIKTRKLLNCAYSTCTYIYYIHKPLYHFFKKIPEQLGSQFAQINQPKNIPDIIPLNLSSYLKRQTWGNTFPHLQYKL